ncbi:MAG: zinc metallochaperone GTPase ZigA, partial [Pseudomonadota bacterium]
REGKKFAVIVNDMSEINIDAEMVHSEVSLNRSEEKLVQMSNGCICCTLREDLLEEVTELAQGGRFDYLLIESTGISEPLPVAETFTFADEDGITLSKLARLDTMVTVVDAVNFLNDYESSQSLQDTGESLGDDDHRTLADLLIDQVEFADVILISKVDLVDESSLERLSGILRSFNTEAEIIPIEHGNVAIDRVLDTGRFDFARAQRAPGWLKEMRGEHVPETEEYGISSFSYLARRPFHPKRFHDFLRGTRQYGKLLRGKGYFWLATRLQFAGQWSRAGGISRISPGGMFWKAVPESEWPTDPDYRAAIMAHWQEPYGDMRQQLVFIGQGLDETAVRAALDACLLSDAELHKGLDCWKTFEDPFPAWNLY